LLLLYLSTFAITFEFPYCSSVFTSLSLSDSSKLVIAYFFSLKIDKDLLVSFLNAVFSLVLSTLNLLLIDKFLAAFYNRDQKIFMVPFLTISLIDIIIYNEILK
jgi:hypothetical protein